MTEVIDLGRLGRPMAEVFDLGPRRREARAVGACRRCTLTAPCGLARYLLHEKDFEKVQLVPRSLDGFKVRPATEFL